MHVLYLFVDYDSGQHLMMHGQRAKCWIQRLKTQKKGAVWPSLSFHLLYFCRHMVIPHICSSHAFKIQDREALHVFPLLSLCNTPQAIA